MHDDPDAQNPFEQDAIGACKFRRVCSHDELAATEFVPVGHGMHTVAPIIEYEFGGHA